jgi:ubiquinone/menaquinone biosynthesis C-methylase UbiE
MPTIHENKCFWETTYDWSGAGDEWSAPWGGTQNLWDYVVYPRIQAYLPAHTVLEIAPGFGRWTQFLKQYCDHLTTVDLSSKCVEHCRERFADSPHVLILQNDGRMIPITENSSIDFVFSFDSLVHVESDVLQAYLQEIARVLKPSGTAFIHHSNIGEYRLLMKVGRRLPQFASRAAAKAYLLPIEHWRGESVSASWLASACRQYGLYALKQELINWINPRHLIDCFTTIKRVPAGPKQVLRNYHFMEEAERIRLDHGRS